MRKSSDIDLLLTSLIVKRSNVNVTTHRFFPRVRAFINQSDIMLISFICVLIYLAQCYLQVTLMLFLALRVLFDEILYHQARFYEGVALTRFDHTLYMEGEQIDILYNYI